MPTDPTPQAEQKTCPMCEFEGRPCPGGAHTYALYEDGIHSVEDYVRKCKPSEPSPAPPAQIERPKREQVLTLGGLVRVMYDASEMDDYLDDRDRLQSDLAAMGTDLGVMTEDRDRARDAIYWADGQRGEFRERGPKEGAYWWRKELMERAGLKPVSDRLPEGETKCQIE